ncbi:hypothetical protein KY359_06380 [Candidatus Woesearchaeota archaeon]|nr:hypothetical protein [Candidatus Woesearchaeota archaeon]
MYRPPEDYHKLKRIAEAEFEKKKAEDPKFSPLDMDDIIAHELLGGFSSDAIVLTGVELGLPFMFCDEGTHVAGEDSARRHNHYLPRVRVNGVFHDVSRGLMDTLQRQYGAQGDYVPCHQCTTIAMQDNRIVHALLHPEKESTDAPVRLSYPQLDLSDFVQ